MASMDDVYTKKIPTFSLKLNEKAIVVFGLMPGGNVSPEEKQALMEKGFYFDVDVEENGKTHSEFVAVPMTYDMVHNYNYSYTTPEGKKVSSGYSFKCLSQDPKVQGACCTKFYNDGDKKFGRRQKWASVVAVFPNMNPKKLPFDIDYANWCVWKMTNKVKDAITARAKNDGLAHCIFEVSCDDKSQEEFHQYTITAINYNKPYKESDISTVIQKTTELFDTIEIANKDLSESDIMNVSVDYSGQDTSAPAPKPEPKAVQKDISDIVEDDESTEDIPF
jgi:hypothetical protein